MPDVVVDKSFLRDLVTPLCSDTDINPEVRLLALKITPVIEISPHRENDVTIHFA